MEIVSNKTMMQKVVREFQLRLFSGQEPRLADVIQYIEEQTNRENNVHI